MVTLSHDAAQGSLAEGTSRGDGSAEVLKGQGWRWARSLECWFLPRSRGQLARREVLTATQQALQEAGFDVELTIDIAAVPVEQLEQQRQESERRRAARMEERAGRHEAMATSRDASADQIRAGIPLGQPILVGHHSQRRAERDRDRMAAHDRAALEHTEVARQARAAADRAEHAAAFRHNPVVVANRLQRLETDLRRAQRLLAQVSTPVPDRLLEEQAHLQEQIHYWGQIRDQQLQSGEATSYSADTVAVGDLVKVSGQWWRVQRVNAKSVTVSTSTGTQRAAWHVVQDHRPVVEKVPH